MRSVSSEPSPPTSSGCARIAARIRSAAVELGQTGERRRHPLEGERERHDAAAVDGGRDVRHLRGLGDLLVECLLQRVLGEAVARRLPAARAADGEKARVLPRAVVVDRARRAALLLPALEVVLRRRSLREQAAHGRRSAPARRGARHTRWRSPGRRGRAGRGRAAEPGSASRSSERGRRAADRRRPRRPRRHVRRPRARGAAPPRCRRGARIRSASPWRGD